MRRRQQEITGKSELAYAVGLIITEGRLTMEPENLFHSYKENLLLRENF
jgi:hypothetical protein